MASSLREIAAMATRTITLNGFETRIEDLGMFKCTPTASVPTTFLVRGVVVDRRHSAQSPVAATPATTLVLPMSPEAALGLAVEILRAAMQPNIPLPEGVELRGGTA